MGIGIGLGGFADALNSGREFDLKQQQQNFQQDQKKQTMAVSAIDGLFTEMGNLVKATADAGSDPKALADNPAWQAMVNQASILGQKSGVVPPEQIQARAQTMLLRPPLQDAESKKKVVNMPDPTNPLGYPVPHLLNSDGTATPIKVAKPPLGPSDVIPPGQAQRVNSPQAFSPPPGTPVPTAEVSPNDRVAQGFDAAAAGPAVGPMAQSTSDVIAPPPSKAYELASKFVEPASIDFMAEQALLGNSSATSGYSRGKEGRLVKMAVQDRMTQFATARGMSAEDLNANIAKFGGQKRGASALGQREALLTSAVTQAMSTSAIVESASDAIDRTQYPTINKIILAAQKQTGGENVIKYGIAVNTLINNYARAIGGGNSQLTDTARNEAHSLIETAYTKGQVKSAISQMQLELRRELTGVQSGLETFLRKGDPSKKLTAPEEPSGGASGDVPPPPGFVLTTQPAKK